MGYLKAYEKILSRYEKESIESAFQSMLNIGSQKSRQNAKKFTNNFRR
jgi:hypothetical protein